MASYNTYNNNKTQKENLTSTYSISMSNSKSTIDISRLSISYLSSNLKVNNQPKDNAASNEEATKYDTKNGIVIYISPLKCKMFAREIRNFLSDPVTYNGVGVVSQNSIVTVSNGVEFGKNTPVLVVRKVSDTGEVESSYAYEFKVGYHFSVRGYTGGTDFETVYDDYNKLEIEQFIDTLESFYIASNNAIAHAVADRFSYDMNRFNNKIETIAQAMGVQVNDKSNSEKRKYNNTSFFSNSNGGSSSSMNDYSSNVSYETTTIDDIDD